MTGQRKARWFGSLRILRDGRLRFSPWSYPDLPHVALKVVTDDQITVVRAGRPVMLLWLKGSRILNACWVADLTTRQLQEAVAELRHARQGLDSWIIPALEWSLAQAKTRSEHEAFKIIPELLGSCRELPVAPIWKRYRANVFANAGMSPPELLDNEGTPARKARTVRKQRRAGR